MTKQCVVCDTEFETKASHFDRRKTCSMKCRGELLRREQSGENHPNYKTGKAIAKDFKCKNCGNIFNSDKGHEGRDPQYCSRKCAGERLSIERPIKVCEHCGKEFRVDKLQGKHRFCSVKCATSSNGVLMRGKKRPERSGENAPGWKGGITPKNEAARKSMEYRNWRAEVFNRDNYTCVECGTRGGRLHADHIKPFAYYPELRYEITNGRTLCVPCHKKTDTYGSKALKLDPSLSIKRNGESYKNSNKTEINAI